MLKEYKYNGKQIFDFYLGIFELWQDSAKMLEYILEEGETMS